MSFRKLKNADWTKPHCPIYENQPVTNIVNGVPVHVDNDVDLCDPLASSSMPTPEEYTYENLRDAGLGLESVNTNILNPSNPDTINSIVSSVVSNFSKPIE